MTPKCLLLVALFLGLGSQSIAQPSNDHFASALELTGTSVQTTVDNTGATAEEAEPAHAETEATASIWWRWTAPADGGVTIHTGQSLIDTVLAVYIGEDLSTLSEVASNDEDSTAQDSTSRVTFNASAGTQYWIAVDGYFGESGAIHLSLNVGEPFIAPPNDNFNGILELVTGVPAAGNNHFATVETGESDRGKASVWWYWEAPESGRFNIGTDGSDFDTMLEVYGLLDDGKYSFVGENDDGGLGSTSALQFSADAGRRYIIRVAGYAGATGTIRLLVEKLVPKPFIQWSLTGLDGKRYSSTNLLGKVVILDFWATWCGPCIAEIPSFIELQNEYAPQGLVILGVATDVEGPSIVRPFLVEHNINYPVAMVTSKIRTDVGGVPSIPTTFIIDRNGMLITKYIGTTSKERFEADIVPLLAAGNEVSISAALVNGRLRITWPLAATGYTLMQSAQSAPAVWTAVSAPVNTESSNFAVELPASERARFFRLQR